MKYLFLFLCMAQLIIQPVIVLIRSEAAASDDVTGSDRSGARIVPLQPVIVAHAVLLRTYLPKEKKAAYPKQKKDTLIKNRYRHQPRNTTTFAR